MEEELLEFLLRGNIAVNAGPNAKEMFLSRLEEDFNNGNLLASIFYQVRSLYQTAQDRYFQMEDTLIEDTIPEEKTTLAERLKLQMNDWERKDFKSNPLMQYALKRITEAPKTSAKIKSVGAEKQYLSCNFLQNITDPLQGIKKIEQVCQELPKEWTVLQVCKGPRPETTYSIFPQIHEFHAAIYVTLLRHARSADYPTPLCLRFKGDEQVELFKKYANIANQFKKCINVDPKEFNTRQAKRLYWDMLCELDQHIAQALEELKNFFFPWNFLFTGITYGCGTSAITVQTRQIKAFAIVDEFCDEHHWEANERVLLSLAALHIDSLSELEVHAICSCLTSSARVQAAAAKMLLKLQTATKSTTKASSSSRSAAITKTLIQHYPCILIVDERLDHFFWEELNVHQEMCRVNSLQCLWRLYRLYKERIRKGYLTVNITDGGCLVNPDNNLPRTETRMRSFFEYWTPHWLKKVAQKPTQDELLQDFFKRSCYVYAGHGSGLQYINGKHIARQQVNCVVFLFGCDSSRLHSNGLYSELVGSHLYYHAAKCPTLVGTLMPALDANMDGVATDLLSRWIAPQSKKVMLWQEIERTSWIKEGIIKPKCNDIGIAQTPLTLADAPDYQMGSLCAVLARIHQRLTEPKFYNTVPYVCRGLPVWNCNVQPLPK